MSVYIYAGVGSSPTNVEILKRNFSRFLAPHGIQVKTITENDIKDTCGAWRKDGTLLVIGGGQFTPFKECLGDEGMQAIRAFAAEKTYLGICKGGYGGACNIEYLGADGAKRNTGLKFFNGLARGSLQFGEKPISLYSGNADSAQIIRLRHEKNSIDFPALYWGGPAFEGLAEHKDAKKLITTKGADGSEITMGLKIPVGPNGGKAILLGYHPEALWDDIELWTKRFPSGQHNARRIQREGGLYHPSSFSLGFACLLDDLEIVKGHSFMEQVPAPPVTPHPSILAPAQ